MQCFNENDFEVFFNERGQTLIRIHPTGCIESTLFYEESLCSSAHNLNPSQIPRRQTSKFAKQQYANLG